MKSEQKQPSDILVGISQVSVRERSEFVNKGRLLALPLGYPGMDRAIDPDSSYLNHLALGRGGIKHVLALTDGLSRHLVVCLVDNASGFAIDLAELPEGEKAVGITEIIEDDRLKVLVATQAADGARLRGGFLILPLDGIQEPGYEFSGLDELLHLPQSTLLGLASGEEPSVILFMDDSVAEFRAGELSPAVTYKNGFRALLAKHSGDTTLLLGGDGTFRLYHQLKQCFGHSGTIQDDWGELTSVADQPDGTVFLGTSKGHLLYINTDGKLSHASRTPLAPVRALASGCDNRCLYGFCGSGIELMFEFRSSSQSVETLGVAAASMGVRGYGYAFGDALTGGDGEIYFAEKDRGGHLWMYYPALSP